MDLQERIRLAPKINLHDHIRLGYLHCSLWWAKLDIYLDDKTPSKPVRLAVVAAQSVLAAADSALRWVAVVAFDANIAYLRLKLKCRNLIASLTYSEWCPGRWRKPHGH